MIIQLVFIDRHMNTYLYLPHMSGCATFLPASRRAHQHERRLDRNKIRSKVFELEREATCTWAAPGSGSAAGSTSTLRPPRWCPLEREAPWTQVYCECICFGAIASGHLLESSCPQTEVEVTRQLLGGLQLRPLRIGASSVAPSKSASFLGKSLPVPKSVPKFVLVVAAAGPVAEFCAAR